jgi:hypothetical protein
MKPGAGQADDGNIRIGPVLRGGRRKPMLYVGAQPWTFEKDMSAHGREICRASRAGSLPYVCVVGGLDGARWPAGWRRSFWEHAALWSQDTPRVRYENTVVLRNPQGASKVLWWLSPGLLFIPNQFVPAGGRLQGGPFILRAGGPGFAKRGPHRGSATKGYGRTNSGVPKIKGRQL